MNSPQTNGNRCEYCKQVPKSGGVHRLNSTELLEMMKEHNPQYNRRSLFCQTCTNRMIMKLRRRKVNEKRASISTGEQTTSYSNHSSSESFLNASSQSSQIRRRQAGPNRNVARRTSGRPNNPDNSSTSSSGMVIPNLSPLSDSDRSNQSQPRLVVDVDVDVDNGGSMQIAPMPSNREQRSQQLNRPPTPERMQNMSPAERSQHFQTFNRGSGG